MANFLTGKFYCMHAVAGDNCCIQIRKLRLEISMVNYTIAVP